MLKSLPLPGHSHLNPVLRLNCFAPSSRPEFFTPMYCILKVMETLVKQDSGSGGFNSLMSAALERKILSATAIWQLLLAAQETETCPLNLLLEEVGKEPGAGAFFQAGELSALCLGVAPIETTVDPQEIRGLLGLPSVSLPSGATASKCLCFPTQWGDCT